MAIPIPVTKTRIATVPWGIPITNEVNRLTAVVAATPWVQVTLQNGYAHGAPPVMYRKVGDIVYVRGLMTGTGTFVTAFNLPVGFRPPATLTLAGTGVAAAGFWQGAEMTVLATGDVSNSTTSMATICPNIQFSITP